MRRGRLLHLVYYENKQPDLCIATNQAFCVEGQILVKRDTSALADNY